MKSVLILGAAGQIGQLVTKNILEQTNLNVVLYGRNVSKRLNNLSDERVEFVDGDFDELSKLKQAMADVDMVYLSFVGWGDLTQNIVSMMDELGVTRYIAANIPDIYDEVEGPFKAWYQAHMKEIHTGGPQAAAKIIEASDLDYVILRITWLYDEPGNTNVHVTRKGEPLRESQVTREAVAQFVTDLVDGKQNYHRESLGLGESDTDWDKPSFY
ncbi:NAD(P)H-binding protein [Paucilactobacillus nenjiangensis]|uniref:NAD(P)H-binding protein n=1 Tax=Paucilactobacillus nenjiangensis TaxID=1296540 RepID=UPI003BB1ECD2